ncbi:Sorting nexin, cytoplasm-to-vacuole targeting pathway/endosomal sorting [Entomophthora muscae]|uniref:Sorting nexin, cytoplasm-to-vacuole targeting pathway/endosomal sorting n=1 Tax=Entomophthora muscae TaxID=34485 RepID=A0ACC2TES9_9FUNG|nr:Sorting nexin, cytoplasm-to-vacuole targeting pathway/endosomal sorting [Entomophthora muscae]
MPDIYSANYSTPGMSASTHETPQNQFCSHLNCQCRKNSEMDLPIILLTTFNFSTYEARRRYSEFESLRDALAKLYPTVLVPPIPDKHSIAQYATKHTRAKEDMHIIEKRKRIASILSQQNRRSPNPCF